MYATRFGSPANDGVGGLALDGNQHLVLAGSIEGAAKLGGAFQVAPGGKSALLVMQLAIH